MDFESTASTNSATEAIPSHCTVYCASEKGGILFCSGNDDFINTDVTKTMVLCSGCVVFDYVNCPFVCHDVRIPVCVMSACQAGVFISQNYGV